MELRQIRTFLSVAETLHFGRSAKLLHLSQPALSLQIKSLEEELEVKLLERGRQGTALTEAGRIFRDEVVTALEQLEVASQKARWTTAGELGRIRVGFVSTAGHEIVPNLIRRFRKLYPSVDFSLRNILTNDQIGMIHNRTLDVGFLRLPIESNKGIDVTVVHREPLVVVLPANHALATQKEIRLRKLDGERFLMYDRPDASGFHDFLLGLLSRAGAVPNIVQTASEMPTLISLVDSGMGVALMPESATRQRFAKITVCPVADRIPPSEIGMIVAKGNGLPAVQRFCELAQSIFRI
ncbi:LysR family transcriptional regulator [Edaphobacter sp. HDX4]|uniref:LysR family transcriptional regulator n=1 Tax=Edaphobacter sp. HDX4 TaxID=2794064 RepID=UPI002FE5571E